MRLFRIIIGAIVESISMTALIGMMELRRWFRDPLHDTQQPASFLREVVSESLQDFKGNLIAVQMEDGQVASEIAVGSKGAIPS